ncbi:hypothetical protein N476_15515 [Pseudoalteromonas luteoviolacea H33]|uniref:Uncharacterized protein n=1 Tax=Pseudoalteromonas luteoviolacea H33 TaxID=1365251 RepID=A0A161Y5B0_9GAMM|nr:hypothetical protein N476_15515 [Pseudoalteromonas luteoviolacea H33]KZN77640.1 hypothetical protein N477_11760 [Pseudoalteromonas luteoviolacea H33-S]
MTYLFLILANFAVALICRKVSSHKLSIIEGYFSSAYPSFYKRLSLDKFDIGRKYSFVYNLAEFSSAGELQNLNDAKLKEHVFELYLADIGVIFFSVGSALFLSIMVLGK